MTIGRLCLKPAFIYGLLGEKRGGPFCFFLASWLIVGKEEG